MRTARTECPAARASSMNWRKPRMSPMAADKACLADQRVGGVHPRSSPYARVKPPRHLRPSAVPKSGLASALQDVRQHRQEDVPGQPNNPFVGRAPGIVGQVGRVRRQVEANDRQVTVIEEEDIGTGSAPGTGNRWSQTTQELHG